MNMKLSLLGAMIVFCAACTQPVTPPSSTSNPQATAVTTKASTSTATTARTAARHILTKAQAEARLVAGAALFDARTADEFAAGHVNNAINVPLDLLQPTLPALDSYKTQEILVVGKDHQQVESMRDALRKAGFTNVLNAASLNS